MRQPLWQVLSEARQYCPVAQSVSAVHCTQVFVLVLQTGVEPLQWLFAVHCTQVLVAQMPLAQTLPQLPQLFGSLVMLMQKPALGQ